MDTTYAQAVHVAGRFGYMQATATADEIARGYTQAWFVVDFSVIEDDGEPSFVYADPFATRGAAISVAKQLHDYYTRRGDQLHRLAIREWAEELTGQEH